MPSRHIYQHQKMCTSQPLRYYTQKQHHKQRPTQDAPPRPGLNGTNREQKQHQQGPQSSQPTSHHTEMSTAPQKRTTQAISTRDRRWGQADSHNTALTSLSPKAQGPLGGSGQQPRLEQSLNTRGTPDTPRDQRLSNRNSHATSPIFASVRLQVRCPKAQRSHRTSTQTLQNLQPRHEHRL